MVFTPNKNMEQPARGSNVGVWDVPVNTNTGIIDQSFGGTATVALVSSPVTLSAAQYQCVFINFTGALLASVTVTFPFVGSFYTIENQTTNSSAFTITLATTVAGSQAICAPAGEAVDIKTDGNTGNIKYRNLGRVGSYLEIASLTVPNWISGCTVAPYLNCTGVAFSSATYPVLAGMIGTTLPDRQGRVGIAYNNGTGRITTAGGGIDGNTLLAGGALQTTTLSSQTMPSYSLDVVDLGHAHPSLTNALISESTTAGNTRIKVVGPGADQIGGLTATAAVAVTNITVNSGGGGLPFSNLPPGVIYGISLIRAA